MTKRKPDPWEQRPDESAQAFALFEIYLNIPPYARSKRRAVEEAYELDIGLVGSPNVTGTHSRWMAKHEWVKRAGEYDRHRSAEVRKKREFALDQARDLQANYGRAMANKGMQVITKADVERVQPAAAVQMVKVGSDLERRALGEADKTVDVNVIKKFKPKMGDPSRAADEADEEDAAIAAGLDEALEDEDSPEE